MINNIESFIYFVNHNIIVRCLKHMFQIKSKRGFTIGSVVAVVIGLIMVIALAVPVTQDIVTSANLTGVSATIANLLPLLLIVGAIILVSRLYSA